MYLLIWNLKWPDRFCKRHLWEGLYEEIWKDIMILIQIECETGFLSKSESISTKLIECIYRLYMMTHTKYGGYKLY